MARSTLSYDNLSESSSQFLTQGHPGKYISAYTYTSGQVDFTGSNYGYGAVIMAVPGGATMSLSDGGEILTNNLIVGHLYDLSVSKITGGTSSEIYVLKRQQ